MQRFSLITLIALSAAGCELIDEISDDSGEETVACEESDKVALYADRDGDGYGSDTDPKEGCVVPEGYVEVGGDCDDDDAEISPDADEVCDGADNNCDAITDEDAVDAELFFADDDGDGYGDEAITAEACEAPSGFTAEAGDCDDTDADVSEVCTAEVRFINMAPGSGLSTLHVDVDQDGIDDATATLDFTQGAGYAEIPYGASDLYVTDASGAEIVRVSFPFSAGERYSFAYLSQPGIMIKWNDLDNIGADETRINLRNVHQSGDVSGWWGYFNGSGYPVAHSYDLGPNGETIYTLPTHDDAVQLEAVFEGEDDLLVDWEAAPLVNLFAGALLDVYLTTAGDCSYLSATCEPWLVAQAPDGSTFTLAESHGWIPQ